MKLRTITLSLLLALVTSLLCPAWADVLWEPVGDTFYDRHAQSCETVDRVYVVPEDSSLTLYRSPEDGTVVAQYFGGERMYVNQSLNVGGELWAVGYPLSDYDTQGWFRLGRLQLEYDTEQFIQDFQASFTEYQGQLDEYQVQDQLYTWTYPGSGVYDSVFTPDLLGDMPITCQYVYTDPEGGQWGYVGYYMGRCGWVYLDHPESDRPPVFPQEAANTVTETGPETAPGPLWHRSIVWAMGLIVLVTAVTAGLLLRSWNQRKA